MLTIELSRLVYSQLNLKIVDEAEFFNTSNSLYSWEILTVVVLLFAVLAVAAAQRRVRLVYPRFPVYAAQDETYAASLGGAKVGATGGSAEAVGWAEASATTWPAPLWEELRSASTEGRAEDDLPSSDELTKYVSL
ncbi:hypothetical protein CEXT_529111 [Caerostris extrusa]|uniref:ATP synthase F0 subunit 8 n=1 Tax=Caerostris extrusa TaxID=172846 RepID=A0AAV4PKL8_CAEEX|nr:hypothetical protein CEXT_529111 [Caerostris extrusa]